MYLEEYSKWKEEFKEINKKLLKKYLNKFDEKSIIRFELNYNSKVDSLTLFEITEKKI